MRSRLLPLATALLLAAVGTWAIAERETALPTGTGLSAGHPGDGGIADADGVLVADRYIGPIAPAPRSNAEPR